MSEQKKDIGQEILKEINQDQTPAEHVRKPFLGKAAIPLLAIVTGLIIGALLIAITSQSVYAAFGESIGKGFSTAFSEIGTAYKALFTGAIGDPIRMINAVGGDDAKELRQAFNPFLESLVQSTPYIFAGLAVALASDPACSTSVLKVSSSLAQPARLLWVTRLRAYPHGSTCRWLSWQARSEVRFGALYLAS